jgi:ATP-binding cassette subfamily F protein uup
MPAGRQSIAAAIVRRSDAGGEEDGVALMRLAAIRHTVGLQVLLDGVDLRIAPRERIGLLGRNGQGKSTLLRILDGSLAPEGGTREVAPGLSWRLLPQEVPDLSGGRVGEIVARGWGERWRLQEAYRALNRETPAAGDGGRDGPLPALQQALEKAGGWIADHEVARVLTPLGLDPHAAADSLSAGFKRRVLLARTLVAEPDLLLLDEPTNHLDLPAIGWLEEFLLRSACAVVLVTHDRACLGRLATRIVELDRGRLYGFPGDYAAFLARKEAALAVEARQEERQARELAREEAWIRQGVKARRTRNQGRVRALERLREERRQRRAALGDVRLRLQEAERSGRLVIAAEGVALTRGGRSLLQDLDLVVHRGDRVGIVGPNGAGKTSLLQLLLQRLPPDRGRVRLGTGLQIAYFDQLREQLDPRRSVAENLAGGEDYIPIAGRPRHVLGYLGDFLFTADRARQPVRSLSGGEKNRLLLARLFARPANLLVLDEPTNDLDLETLELLEERLHDFHGTVLLVSHDRAFLDAVATSTLVFEGPGELHEYVGGYSDWQRQRRPPARREAAVRPAAVARRPTPAVRKRTFNETRELAQLPARIEALEREQAELLARMADTGFYRHPPGEIAAAADRLTRIAAQLAEAYARWQALEDLAP